MMKTNRSVLKFVLLGLVTFGIYDIVFYYYLNEDMNKMQKDRKISQMNFVGVFFLGLVTLGIVPLIWFIKFGFRFYDEAKYKKVKTEGNAWWFILGTLLLDWTVAVPIITHYQMINTMNRLAEDYNETHHDEQNYYGVDPQSLGYNSMNYNTRYINYSNDVNNGNILYRVRKMKRHNFFSSMTGVILILLGLMPALFMVIPLFSIKQSFADSHIFQQSLYINMWDIIDSIFRASAKLRVTLSADFRYIAQTDSIPVSNAIYLENIYAILFWWALAQGFGIFLFVQGLVCVIRGRLNHHFGPVLGTLVITFNLLFVLLDTIRLGWYYNNAVIKCTKVLEIGGPINYRFLPVLPIVAASLSLLAFIAITLVYFFYFFGRHYQEDIETVDILTEDDLKHQPYETDNGLVRNTLPKGMTAIGGHAFAKNTNLQIATINKGIKTLGPGAFANCINLQVVTLPLSLEKIEYNCFFNCSSLSRINYEGTKQDWSKISRGSNWLSKAGTTTVICKDGAISVNPYR